MFKAQLEVAEINKTPENNILNKKIRVIDSTRHLRSSKIKNKETQEGFKLFLKFNRSLVDALFQSYSAIIIAARRLKNNSAK